MFAVLRNRFTNGGLLMRSLASSSSATTSSSVAFAMRRQSAALPLVCSRGFLTARGSSSNNDDGIDDHRRPKPGSASSIGAGSENGRQFKRLVESGDYDEVIDRFGEICLEFLYRCDFRCFFSRSLVRFVFFFFFPSLLLN